MRPLRPRRSSAGEALANGASEEDACSIRYSILASGHDSDADKIARDFLESTGAITNLIVNWKAKPAVSEDFYGDTRYALVWIGLGAMSHGIVLAEDFLDTIREIFTECGFMRDSLKQIDTALNGPDGFKNDGTPYDIFKMGRHGVNTNADADLLYPPRSGAAFHMMNTPAPFGLFGSPSNAVLIKDIKANMERVKQSKVGKVCGQCGGSQAPLMLCGRCKARSYCNVDCQKKHWSTHKLVCGKTNTTV